MTDTRTKPSVDTRHLDADSPRTRRARAWRVLVVDGLVLLGLAGVAVTQPVLDLFGSNPTFFVAGGYGRRQIVAFALVVAFVPGLVA
jgi:hypothetical protein